MNEAQLPTIMKASSDMESERGTPESGPGRYALRPSHRGGLLQPCPNAQDLGGKDSLSPGQKVPKRVRFVRVPSHDSGHDDTRLIRARVEHSVEEQHSRSSVATDEQMECNASRIPLCLMDEARVSQGPLQGSHGLQDAKVWRGMKYERKTQGPFAGGLVSQGTIITIDGEEYVEYRVLIKLAGCSHPLRKGSS